MKTTTFFIFLFLSLVITIQNEYGDMSVFDKCIYRVEFNITNNLNSTIYDHDVMLPFRTEGFVNTSTTKIQLDCADVRIMMENNGNQSQIPFWMENECGLNVTRVWVTIPEIEPSATVNVYIYYYCIGETESTEISHKMNFFFPSNGTCDNIMPQRPGFGVWNHYAAGDGKYFSAAEDFSVIQGSNDHVHNMVGSTKHSGPTPPKVDSSLDKGDHPFVIGAFYYHEHVFYFLSENSTYEPPYFTVPICTSNQLDRIPKNSLILMDEINGDHMANGISLYEDSLGIFLRGGNVKGESGGSYYHEHEYRGWTEFSTVLKKVEVQLNLTFGMSANHKHWMQGTLNMTRIVPPFTRVIWGVTKNDIMEYDSHIYIMADSIPPKGWTQVHTFNDGLLQGVNSSIHFGTKGGDTLEHYHEYENEGLTIMDNMTEWFTIVSDTLGRVAIFDHTHPGWNFPNGKFTHQTEMELPKVNFVMLKRKEVLLDITDGVLVQLKPEPVEEELFWLLQILYENLMYVIFGAVVISLILIVIIVILISLCVTGCALCVKREKTLVSEGLLKNMMDNAKDELELEQEKEDLRKEKEALERKSFIELEEKESLQKQLEKIKKEKKTLMDRKLIIDSDLKVIDFEEVKCDKILGKGAEYVIHKGEWSGQTVLFRIFNKGVFKVRKFNIFSFFLKELQEYSFFSHPNIMRYIAYSKAPDIGVVTEFVDNGPLKFFCSKMKQKGAPIEFHNKLELILGIARGLEYLHGKGVVHKDLHATNVFVGKNYHVKIDFGYRKTFTKNYQISHYAAPELVLETDEPKESKEVPLNEKWNTKCDIFSFGIVMFEIITNNFNPYNLPRRSKEKIGQRVADDPTCRPDIAKHKKYIPNWCLNLIQICWSHDPYDRPTSKKIRQIIETIQKYSKK